MEATAKKSLSGVRVKCKDMQYLDSAEGPDIIQTNLWNVPKSIIRNNRAISQKSVEAKSCV